MDNKEQIREGITALMENFWITKRAFPDEYMYVKNNKESIQKYFSNHFGYRLLTGIDLFKLEKIPYKTEGWMGIQSFSDPMDYSIFVAILAYLEDKSKDDLFLISTMSDYIKSFFYNEMEIKWEKYKHRLSFYRAMKHAQTMDLIEALDGEIEKYKTDEKVEILYRPTMISKYYMRFFSKPIEQFENLEEILVDRWKIPGVEANPRIQLQSLYRRIFFSPVVYKQELTDEEKKYFVHQAHRFVESIPEHTHFELEIYRNEILLIAKEKNVSKEQHPNQKVISDIVVQLAKLVKDKITKLPEEEFPSFELIIGRRKFDQWVEELHNELGFGWSNEFRNAFSHITAGTILDYLEEWKMAKEDKDTHSVILYPPFVRIGGQYPREYLFEKYFIDKVRAFGLFSDHEKVLSIDIFEDILEKFNQNHLKMPLRLKSALDVIDKYIMSKDETFIELNEEKIMKAFKGVY